MAPLSEEIKLKEELRQAIEDENFEEAAVLRDRLRSLGAKTPAGDRDRIH